MQSFLTHSLWDYRPVMDRVAHKTDALVGGEIGNAPVQTSVRKLARMQTQRFWIERAFQDAKSHIGMAQYQIRGNWKPYGGT